MVTIWRHYRSWVLGIVAFNVSVYLRCDHAAARHLGFDARWPVRIGIISALLLFDTLLVLWWYAHETGQQVETARRQFDLSKRQFNLAMDDWVFRTTPRYRAALLGGGWEGSGKMHLEVQFW
ncbi:MAG: hypothetical protein M3505_07160, partial [Verrucomicrobiota bacterium]|nr:hypothetical protein [Verrucomicrobiota bacterium]